MLLSLKVITVSGKFYANYSAIRNWVSMSLNRLERRRWRRNAPPRGVLENSDNKHYLMVSCLGQPVPRTQFDA